MSDYIKREDAINVFDWGMPDADVKCGIAIQNIKDIPSADVVEVVRCKDCKYATYDKSIDRYDCRNWGLDGDEYTEADGFCSFGERKEG